jgi:hypothetical protein
MFEPFLFAIDFLLRIEILDGDVKMLLSGKKEFTSISSV